MTLGCDIGTGYTKAVVLERGEIKFAVKVPTEANPERAMQRALAMLEREQGLTTAEIGKVAVTGWGQGKVSLAHEAVPTIKCLAKAAIWDLPSCKSVLCLGTQQSMVLSVNEEGRVLDYKMNEKCASGAGMFLELILDALECSVEDSARLAATATKELVMSSQCAVFAESEVVSLLNDGESPGNIVEAILRAIARSVGTVCKKIRLRDDVVVGGGLANNLRIVGLLEDSTRTQLHVFRPRPDFIGAIGAALNANGGS